MTVVALVRPWRRRRRIALIARVVRTLIVVELAVRRRSPVELCARFGIEFAGFSAPRVVPSPLTRDIAVRWWAVESVLRWWPWGRDRPCLRRSITLGAQLRHLQPTLCIEVLGLSPFVAHASLVANGHRLDMGDAGPFVASVDAP